MRGRQVSKATAGVLRGLAAGDLADGLDRLYCYEQSVARWCTTVERRLTGFATFVLPNELADAAKASADAGQRLAARVVQLGGELTADPGSFVVRSPLDRLELPRDPADVAEVLALALAVERVGIASYARLVVRLGDGDAVTHRLLTAILADKLAREDERDVLLRRLDELGLGALAAAERAA